MSDEIELVGIEEIRAARRGLAGVLRPTPVESSSNISGLCDRPVRFKTEYRQRTGSFKIRGAYHHIASLPDDDDGGRRAVVAASAGNHAQGVALAAALLGRSAIVFMPTGTALPKVEATRAYGADVRLTGVGVEDALAAAHDFAAEHGAHLVPPFDDRLVIAGQGTLGLELAEEIGDAEVVLVPIGGGGLISGVAAALAVERPEVRVVGVEAAGAASMVASLAAGAPVELTTVRTIADGIALKSPSALTFAHVRALVDDVVTVTDEEIGRALILLLERAKAVVEPSGAVGLAALLAGRVRGSGPVAVVLSGGNVDPLMLMRLIEHGLSAAGRYLRLRVVVPDRPGALAAITQTVADLGINVLAVEH
ncbi:MAG: threonine ammonia-lyase, partial [Acidimicrobiales bacterium]